MLEVVVEVVLEEVPHSELTPLFSPGYEPSGSMGPSSISGVVVVEEVVYDGVV